jgi:hypothetical protein
MGSNKRVVTTSTPNSESIALAGFSNSGTCLGERFYGGNWFRDAIISVLEENQLTVLKASGDYKSGNPDHYRSVQFYMKTTFLGA